MTVSAKKNQRSSHMEFYTISILVTVSVKVAQIVKEVLSSRQRINHDCHLIEKIKHLVLYVTGKASIKQTIQKACANPPEKLKSSTN